MRRLTTLPPAAPELQPDPTSVLDRLLAPDYLAALAERAAREREAFRRAMPFPHAVLEDLLPEDVAERARAAFPGAEDIPWERFSRETERKLAFRHVEQLSAPLRDLLWFLNSAPFLEFLSELTGIQGLVADAHYVGGGLHRIERGGSLAIHADFNRLPSLRLDRRLNVILFLNGRDWKEEYGGHLELWHPDMSACARKVLPVLNRCVVFCTTDDALHGHPDPLRCPEGEARKSLATYYYTNGRPEEERRPDHTTLFRARPGERFAPSLLSAAVARRAARAVLPPIVSDVLRGLRKQLRTRTKSSS